MNMMNRYYNTLSVWNDIYAAQKWPVGIVKEKFLKEAL